MKFDVNRADKHIIQSIAILDNLDRDINTFATKPHTMLTLYELHAFNALMEAAMICGQV